MRKYVAEFIGTFTLVFFGCGSAVVAGNYVGYLGIAFAFGLSIVAMAYTVGPISGCHVNPAVSIGMFVAGKMTVKDLIGFIIAQFIGAIVASCLLMIVTQQAMSSEAMNLGQNVYADGKIVPALIFEFVATFIFIIVILGATSNESNQNIAGMVIGLTLTLIHIVGIPITGVSVNPARSFGPAIFVGGKALSSLWLFLVVPTVAGLIAGLLYRMCPKGKNCPNCK